MGFKTNTRSRGRNSTVVMDTTGQLINCKRNEKKSGPEFNYKKESTYDTHVKTKKRFERTEYHQDKEDCSGREGG